VERETANTDHVKSCTDNYINCIRLCIRGWRIYWTQFADWGLLKYKALNIPVSSSVYTELNLQYQANSRCDLQMTGLSLSGAVSNDKKWIGKHVFRRNTYKNWWEDLIKRPLGTPRCRWNNINRLWLNKVGGCGLDTSGSGWKPIAVLSHHDTELRFP
jgi:hypothetical protein